MGKLLVSSLLVLGLSSACSEEPPTKSIRSPGTIAGPNTGPQAGATGASTPPATTTPAGVSGTFGSTPMLMPIAGTSGLAAGGSGAVKPESCGDAIINTGRVTPVVWLVIDGSGSMAEPFGDRTRWDALRQALMDPDGGVVPTLDKLVKWGMVMYDGPVPGGMPVAMALPDGGPATGIPPTAECPRLATVEPALNNFAMLDPMYPQLAPGGSTPTHKALAQVQSHLPSAVQAPDQVVDPVYVVLATDGAPNDFCTAGGLFGLPGGNPAAEVIATTTAIAAANIPVYVISLANNDPALSAHLQEVARAGGTGKPPFTPMNKDQLVQTVREIIGPDVFCEVPVKGFGIMESVACQGTVMLNGTKLECGDDGWRLKSPTLIEVTGSACEKFKNENNAVLTANFPCEIILPT